MLSMTSVCRVYRYTVGSTCVYRMLAMHACARAGVELARRRYTCDLQYGTIRDDTALASQVSKCKYLGFLRDFDGVFLHQKLEIVQCSWKTVQLEKLGLENLLLKLENY